MFYLKMVSVVVATLLLAACVANPPNPSKPEEKASTEPVVEKTASEWKLAEGIQRYEAGDFKSASTTLQIALADGLRNKDDEITARKYLAFIHCVSKRERQCRDEFRKVLILDPGFQLQPAEAGHPLWGPVFRKEKEKPAPKPSK